MWVQQPPVLLCDYHCSAALFLLTAPTSSSLPGPQSMTYVLSQYLSCDEMSPSHRAFVAAISVIPEPPTFKWTMKYSHWCEAVAVEIQALEKNNT
ncbi:hypothetical protein AMTR_s00007p00251670 [Amborella trichopoda]|uniref:Uncharacterized protein n=1 Tax=Amborella trichopoda TaxID=13333 RepID=W1PEJ0_AMBTC|nr:hypothetical protein AMTR_s00007p00251670 [Amborella trichopoda]